MISSISSEFDDSLIAIHEGVVSELKSQSKFSLKDIRDSIYGIEIGNAIDAVTYKFKESAVQKAKIIGMFAYDCGIKVSGAILEEWYQKLLGEDSDKGKIACTGVTAPKSITSTGDHYHIRNLEQTTMINTWNKHPVIFFMNEKDGNKKYYKYVAYGTAGLNFPGGISGVNEKGLSVSLHQFHPTVFDYYYKNKDAELTPYLQQRILRECATIEEAERLINKTKILTPWTIFVSDEKTGISASFEVTPKGSQIVRKLSRTGMAQTNIFFAKENQDRHHHSRYNQFIENLSRFKVADEAINQNKGKINLDFMINLSSSRRDWFESNLQHAFGRSVGRVSNIMTTLSIPRPSTHSAEAWVTIADQLPPASGYFGGFNFDFEQMRFKSIGARKNGMWRDNRHYEKSFEYYHYAYIANTKKDMKSVLKNLDLAIKESKKDGRFEFVYHFMKAKQLLNQAESTQDRVKQKELARASDAIFDEIYYTIPEENFHPIRRAVLRMARMRASFLAYGDSYTVKARDQFYNESVQAVKDAQNSVKTKNNRNYPVLMNFLHSTRDLEQKLKLFKEIYENKEHISLPDVDMNSIE